MEKRNLTPTRARYKTGNAGAKCARFYWASEEGSLKTKNPVSLKQMGHISQASRITSVFSHDNSPSNGFKIDYFGFNAAHVGSTYDSTLLTVLRS
jgi:hypothetical protein